MPEESPAGDVNRGLILVPHRLVEVEDILSGLTVTGHQALVGHVPSVLVDGEMFPVRGILETFAQAGHRVIEERSNSCETQPWHGSDLGRMSLMEEVAIFLEMPCLIGWVALQVLVVPGVAEGIDSGSIFRDSHRSSPLAADPVESLPETAELAWSLVPSVRKILGTIIGLQLRIAWKAELGVIGKADKTHRIHFLDNLIEHPGLFDNLFGVELSLE